MLSSSASSLQRKSISTESSSDSGKSNMVHVVTATNVGQPVGKFSLGLSTVPKIPREKHVSAVESSKDDTESSDASSPQLFTTIASIKLVNDSDDGNDFTDINDDDESETPTGIDEDGTDVHESTDTEESEVFPNIDNPNPNFNQIDIEGAVGGASSGVASAKKEELVSRKRLAYIGGCAASILMISIATVLLYRTYGPKSQPSQEFNPNFESAVFDAFKRCASELGINLTDDDKTVIADSVRSLNASYGHKLASISDIGALLECHPDDFPKSLAGIFISFTTQMEALAGAAAGFASPSACLIVLSLVYLFTNGVI